MFREAHGRAMAVHPLGDSGIDDELGGYHLFHAIRAGLLRRLGRHPEAALAYDAALARTENAAERDFLQRNRQVNRTDSRLNGRRLADG